MTELGRSHAARLRRQIFNTLRFGIPLTIAGAGICIAGWVFVSGAQRWLILVCGLVVVIAGAAMLLLAIGTTFLFADAALRGWIRDRRKPKAKLGPAPERTAAVAVPVATTNAAAEIPESPKVSSGPGPLVF